MSCCMLFIAQYRRNRQDTVKKEEREREMFSRKKRDRRQEEAWDEDAEFLTEDGYPEEFPEEYSDSGEYPEE